MLVKAARAVRVHYHSSFIADWISPNHYIDPLGLASCERKFSLKNKIFVVVAIVVAALAFISLRAFLSPPKVTTSGATVASDEKFVRSHSPTFGNSLGRVTVVEWFDPECESCQAFHPAFKKIMKDYGDRVRFVFRYMPYHGGSMFAACALEEARELGKFEEALEVLFEKQPEWGSHHEPRPDLIPSYLSAIGIPKDKLFKEYLIKKHGEKIKIDEADGKAVGVNGTPTFFVNGQMVPVLSESVIRGAIAAALAAK